jgi:hypothetical protein
VTACERGSLGVCACVCVCRGYFVYQVDTGWVGLDGMWGSLCVCCVSIRGDWVLKGRVGGSWAGVFMKNRPYRGGNKREVA